MKKLLVAAAVGAAFLSSTAAQAVPWCWKGHIVEIGDVQWTQSQIIANFGPTTIPPYMTDPDRFIAFTAAYNYANSFSGGGGSWGGYTVPGSGQVMVDPYAPYSYVSQGPGFYNLSQGLYFKMKKCFTVPVMIKHPAIRDFELSIDNGSPDPVLDPAPFDGLENMTKYWSTKAIEIEVPRG